MCPRRKKAQNKQRWITYTLGCDNYLVSRKVQNESDFVVGNLQHVGTTLQIEHGKGNRKGKNGLAKTYRVSSKHALSKEDTCAFCLYVFCSTSDERWFIGRSSNARKNTKPTQLIHCNHLPLCPSHMITHKNHICTDMKLANHDLISSGASNDVIVKFAMVKYDFVLSHSQICQFKVGRMNEIIEQFKDNTDKQPPNRIWLRYRYQPIPYDHS